MNDYLDRTLFIRVLPLKKGGEGLSTFMRGTLAGGLMFFARQSEELGVHVDMSLNMLGFLTEAKTFEEAFPDMTGIAVGFAVGKDGKHIITAHLVATHYTKHSPNIHHEKQLLPFFGELIGMLHTIRDQRTTPESKHFAFVLEDEDDGTEEVCYVDEHSIIRDSNDNLVANMRALIKLSDTYWKVHELYGGELGIAVPAIILSNGVRITHNELLTLVNAYREYRKEVEA